MTANGKAKFCLGQIVGTPDCLAAITASGQTPAFFLDRHAQGDWGEVQQTTTATGPRLASSYRKIIERRTP